MILCSAYLQTELPSTSIVGLEGGEFARTREVKNASHNPNFTPLASIRRGALGRGKLVAVCGDREIPDHVGP